MVQIPRFHTLVFRDFCGSKLEIFGVNGCSLEQEIDGERLRWRKGIDPNKS